MKLTFASLFYFSSSLWMLYLWYLLYYRDYFQLFCTLDFVAPIFFSSTDGYQILATIMGYELKQPQIWPLLYREQVYYRHQQQQHVMSLRFLMLCMNAVYVISPAYVTLALAASLYYAIPRHPHILWYLWNFCWHDLLCVLLMSYIRSRLWRFCIGRWSCEVVGVLNSTGTITTELDTFSARKLNVTR